jgi:hypothetical protein|tara:strand:- start:1991 stop:2137 length:147 start_codon:yes stop_codon:yes gene_type:complete
MRAPSDGLDSGFMTIEFEKGLGGIFASVLAPDHEFVIVTTTCQKLIVE